MTFKDLIENHACESGVAFCAKRDYDFARIMEDAALYLRRFILLDGREEVLMGLRVTLKDSGLEHDSMLYGEARDAAIDWWCDGPRDKETWHALVMLHQLLLLDAGVEF